MNCRTHEHRHFERTLRSTDPIPGPRLAEGRLLIKKLLTFYCIINCTSENFEKKKMLNVCQKVFQMKIFFDIILNYHAFIHIIIYKAFEIHYILKKGVYKKYRITHRSPLCVV